MFNGLVNLPWWGYIVVALVFTHITIAAVTIFLHRGQAHRSLDLHPIISHFFRFWLWLTTGMVTKEWAAIHRKHHAACETVDDPHSPQILGIKKVFWEGAELYRKESKNLETLEKYGKGTPDDWIERHLYTPYSARGIALMAAINILLFGPLGLTIWAVQMAWIPVTAAGIINGIGHYWGYRNFSADDASTNISPWGIIIGGEELHNNHHAYPTSAKLSSKWFEFDIGWLYIRTFEILGLANVKRVAPKVKLDLAKTMCDAETVQAVITHRYEVMGKYVKSLKQIMSEEIQHLRTQGVHFDVITFRRWLHLGETDLKAPEQAELKQALNSSKVLATIYAMRQELAALWGRSSLTQEQLVKQLNDWCKRAESSGIEALQQFSQRLRCYA
ncbi:MAG: fatty acid desaturase [Burkholderiales bacterium]|nr:fatty acid desaturase [Burkholderiales bacterium]